MKNLNSGRVVSILSFIATSAAFIASSAALSACGTHNQVYGDWANTGSTTGLQTSNSTGSNMQQQCSAMPNVSGTGFSNTIDREFRVCKGTAVGAPATTLAIFPEDQTQKQVCLFPLQVSNGQASIVVVNPYVAPIGRYAVQCGVIATGGASMSFGSLQFQGGYIVNYSDAAQFAYCISTGNISNCAINSNIGYSVGYWN